MNITIIGTGYVGLVTGTCFAEMGNKVYCVDIDEEKINNLKNGILPIYEPNLWELVNENQEKGELIFTTDLKEGLKNSNMIFIAVGTPMNEDGTANLTYVKAAANNIADNLTQSVGNCVTSLIEGVTHYLELVACFTKNIRLPACSVKIFTNLSSSRKFRL